MKALRASVLLLVALSCTPREEAPRFDLKTLFYAAPTDVDKAFGKPTGGSIITQTDQIPGEHREYDYAPENKHVLARFFRNKCVMIQIELPRRYDDALEALRSMGIDASSISPMVEAPAATRWTAKVGGTIFKDVAAINSSMDGSSGFDTVQFELAEP